MKRKPKPEPLRYSLRQAAAKLGVTQRTFARAYHASPAEGIVAANGGLILLTMGEARQVVKHIPSMVEAGE